MRSSWLTSFGLTSVIMALVGVLVGCGAQTNPGGGGPPSAVQESGAAVVKAGTMWDIASEPPLHKIGGIPPADLTDEPKYGSTLIHGYGGTGGRMDPHFSQGLWTERWQSRVFADGLVEWDLKCNCPAPELAESWKQLDDLTFDFKIRKGVKFHNVPPVKGREMTIQDVKWSLDRLAGLGERPKGVISVNYERFASVKEFQILDDSTLRMTLKQADSQIFRDLMYDYGVVLPKEAMIDGSFMDPAALIGTGPFIVELAQPTGQSRFKRNPDYWKKDSKGRPLPYLDAVWTLGASASAAIQAALKTGQAHWVILQHNTGKVFLNDPQYRIYNTANSAVGTSGFFMNVNQKPFDDIRVRRAINLAVDRDELGIGEYGPGGYYKWTFLGAWEPFSWSPNKLNSMAGYATGPAKQKELDEAKKLLAEAGYPNGFEFTCECENVEVSEIFSEQMKRINVKVNVRKVTSTDMRWTAYMKDKQSAFANMGGGYTPDYSLVQYFLCTAVKNLAVMCDQEVDALYKEFRATYDERKQIESMHKVQDRLWEIMPVAVMTRSVYYHLSYNWVRGWRNQMYDCCWAHGNNVAYTWLDK